MFPLTFQSTAIWRIGFPRFPASAIASALNSFGHTCRSLSFVLIFFSSYCYISRLSLCPPDGIRSNSLFNKEIPSFRNTKNPKKGVSISRFRYEA
jgi:hypothetical protein